jgi:NAD(P)-dependent dehydrogenase (short-subunit alcohol dehydrogenase family)
MKDLEEIGGKVMFLDVTDEQTIKKAVETIIKNENKIDVVYANSGYACTGALETVDIDDAKAEFDVNLFGVARTIKAVMPQMRKQGYGYIIVTSSLAGIISQPIMPYYPASKYALEGMIDGFRMETKKFGIKVVKIQPSFIDTDFIIPAMKTLAKAFQAENAQAYKEEFISFKKNFTRLITNAPQPIKVARVVSKVISKKNPKRQYSVSIECIIGKIAKRIFGDWIVDKVMTMMFLG